MKLFSLAARIRWIFRGFDWFSVRVQGIFLGISNDFEEGFFSIFLLRGVVFTSYKDSVRFVGLFSEFLKDFIGIFKGILQDPLGL